MIIDFIRLPETNIFIKNTKSMMIDKRLPGKYY